MPLSVIPLHIMPYSFCCNEKVDQFRQGLIQLEYRRSSVNFQMTIDGLPRSSGTPTHMPIATTNIDLTCLRSKSCYQLPHVLHYFTCHKRYINVNIDDLRWSWTCLAVINALSNNRRQVHNVLDVVNNNEDDAILSTKTSQALRI